MPFLTGCDFLSRSSGISCDLSDFVGAGGEAGDSVEDMLPSTMYEQLLL